MKLKRILYWATIVILVAIILVCGFKVGSKLITDAQDKQDYDELAGMKESYAASITRPTIPAATTAPTVPVETTDPSESTEPDATEPTEFTEGSMIFEYQLMHNINNDMVGWVQITHTQLNYPVVQSPYQADFYLHRNFYKEYAACGTIYAREVCDVNRPSDNITLYGHNMNNGSMFAVLHKYKDKSFWEDNKYIYFDTLTEYHTYEIFAVFNTTADLTKGFPYHLFSDANDHVEFNIFVSNSRNLSFYDTGIVPEYGDKLLTLSTCDRSIDEGRLVVVARRIV